MTGKEAHELLSGTITGGSVMKRIPLLHGRFTLIEDADFKWLSQWTMNLIVNPTSKP